MEKVLSFDEFVLYLCEHLLEGWHEELTLEVRKISKNNGQILTGLILVNDDVGPAPTYYFENLYQEYANDFSLEEIIDRVRESFEHALDYMQEMNFDLFHFESMRDQIIFRIVNYEKNKEELEDCPHIRLYDLAVTFRCLVSHDMGGMATTLINNILLEEWGVSLAELLVLAQENTRSLLPEKIRPIGRILEEYDYPCEIIEESEELMFVATNTLMANGATVILYDGLLENFGEQIGRNFYLLPCSVHEMLFVPERDEIDVDGLHQMVLDANKDFVDPQEILSDSVYYYDREEHKIICCTPQEE